MKKIIITTILSITILLGENTFSTKEVTNMEKKSRAKIDSLRPMENNIENLNNNFMKTKKNSFLKMTKGKKNHMANLDLVNSVFTGNEFLSNNEGQQLTKELKYQLTESNKPKLFLLYFFSESVPKRSTLNVLLGVDILKQNGFNISSKQYMVGYPEDYKSYMFSWRDMIEEYPIKYRKGVTSSFAMKLDPRFFKTYGITRVPVLALALCQNIVPEPQSCKVEYLMHGDVPLKTFFDKIAQDNKDYKEFSMVLNANGIYKPKKEVFKNEQ